MSLPDKPHLTGEIFDESSALSLNDLTRMFAVDEQRVVEWVEEGVISVIEVDGAHWRISGTQLRRARIALRLERDLGVNPAGVALALQLLEELQRFRRERASGRS
jgi:chaperone modulatory protein CbpM